ncbi:HNH endonuclease signature motif containing protein [Mycolicibacterium conceptionense]|uniref:HNH endonuclease signature motif containing protein n=1 Tax=Mycolicibacterium conceptionense TaxID=451644 RepID=UPI00104279F6
MSNFGRVRSESRTVLRSDGRTQLVHARLLSAVPDRRGYLHVNPFRGNVGHTAYIHQLVMLAFIGPCPEGLVIRHLNGDCTDNRLLNLRYGTPSDNQHDAVVHGTHRNSIKTHCPHQHPYDAANTYVNGRGSRVCRACIADRRKRRKRA